jgi:hypothetical protein
MVRGVRLWLLLIRIYPTNMAHDQTYHHSHPLGRVLLGGWIPWQAIMADMDDTQMAIPHTRDQTSCASEFTNPAIPYIVQELQDRLNQA